MHPAVESVRRPKFDPAKGFEVHKAFVLNGARMVKGDELQARGVPARLLQRLWNQRYIETAKPAAARPIQRKK
jgi:hypothetical protein